MSDNAKITFLSDFIIKLHKTIDNNDPHSDDAYRLIEEFSTEVHRVTPQIRKLERIVEDMRKLITKYIKRTSGN